MGRNSIRVKLPDLSLDQKLAAIGIMMAAEPVSTKSRVSVDIEDTLVEAMVALGNGDSNLRLAGPLLTWVAEHGSAVIVEKLAKLLRIQIDRGTNAPFVTLLARYAAIHGHKRWRTLGDKFSLPNATNRIFGPQDLAESLLALRGADSIETA